MRPLEPGDFLQAPSGVPVGAHHQERLEGRKLLHWWGNGVFDGWGRFEGPPVKNGGAFRASDCRRGDVILIQDTPWVVLEVVLRRDKGCETAAYCAVLAEVRKEDLDFLESLEAARKFQDLLYMLRRIVRQ